MGTDYANAYWCCPYPYPEFEIIVSKIVVITELIRDGLALCISFPAESLKDNTIMCNDALGLWVRIEPRDR